MHNLFRKIRTSALAAFFASAIGLLALPNLSDVVGKEPPPPEPRKLLTLVPQDAMAAVVLSPVDRLKKRLASLQREDGFPEDFLQITDFVVNWLDAKKPLDHQHPVGVVALLNDTPGSELVIDDVVLLAPIKPGVPLNEANIALLVAPLPEAAGDGDVVQEQNYAIIPVAVQGKFPGLTLEKGSLQDLVTPALSKQVNAADIMVFLNPQKIDNSVQKKFDRLRKEAAEWPEVRLRALGMRMVEDMSNVEHTFGTIDLADGLKIQFSALFRNPDGTAPFIVDRLKVASGKHPPHYGGLPDMPLLGATAIGDTTARNTEILTILNRLEFINLDNFMRDAFTIRTGEHLASNLLEFLTSASRESTGARAAIYLDDSLAIIFDTPSPDEVVGQLEEMLANEALAEVFEYVSAIHEIDGIQVDAIRVHRKKVPAFTTPTAKALSKVAAHGLLIAKVGEHVVVTSEPKPKLMKASIANLKSNKPGLATKLTPPQRSEGQTDLVDVRFHASLMWRRANGQADPKKVREDDTLSRMRVQATVQEITTQIDISREEFLRTMRQGLRR
jgi:hypothetical protein